MTVSTGKKVDNIPKLDRIIIKEKLWPTLNNWKK
jgi:hypothetical protein